MVYVDDVDDVDVVVDDNNDGDDAGDAGDDVDDVDAGDDDSDDVCLSEPPASPVQPSPMIPIPIPIQIPIHAIPKLMEPVRIRILSRFRFVISRATIANPSSPPPPPACHPII